MRLSDWSSDVCSSDLSGDEDTEQRLHRRRPDPGFEGFHWALPRLTALPSGLGPQALGRFLRGCVLRRLPGCVLRRGGFLLLGELQGVEPRVVAAARQQLGVAALLDDAAVTHHELGRASWREKVWQY